MRGSESRADLEGLLSRQRRESNTIYTGTYLAMILLVVGSSALSLHRFRSYVRLIFVSHEPDRKHFGSADHSFFDKSGQHEQEGSGIGGLWQESWILSR